MAERKPYLTKSRFKQGLTCERLLWLAWHKKTPYQEAEPGSPAAMGTEVGIIAQSIFEGGADIDAPPWDHAKAVTDTANAMADPSIWAIYEAAFEYQNIRIRIDALETLGRGQWGIREVKASTRVKDDYIADAAIQLYVARGAGVDVGSVELVHLNRDYVRGDGPVEWDTYFARTDITAECEALQDGLSEEVARQFATLNSASEPTREPDRHCPKQCDYWEHCTASKPDNWVYYLPRMRQGQIEMLRESGVEDIAQIPANFDLSEPQARAVAVVKSGEPYIAADIAQELAPISQAEAPTVLYLDFETVSPAIPIFPQTHAYQRIAFQWSLHVAQPDGTLMHDEFLADADAGDPRRKFAETLIEAVTAHDGPVVVYSAYEASILGELAGAFPELATGLLSVQARLFDLLPIIRNSIYMEAFKGSFSVKAVGPALAPHFSYDDLETVKDGAAASQAYYQLITDQLPDNTSVKELRKALLAYCRYDTLAMVEVHRALVKLVDAGSASSVDDLRKAG